MTRRPKKKATRRLPPKRRKAAAKAEPDPLDDFIAGSARALDLKIDKSWMPAVRESLQVTLAHGARVTGFALADDAEPAPIFKA
jgi:hypothetical protein